MKIIKDLITVNNFTKGRKGWEPDRIVIHVTEGSESATESWFDNESSDVSSHYIVSKIGEVRQEVLEEDSAWTEGRVSNPTARVVREREHVNPNYYCIGIEHEGDGNSDLTDAQRIASAELIADIISRRPKITLDRDHILKHREIYDKKTCPGKIDVDKIIAMVKYIQNGNKMLKPRIVYSDYFKDYLIVTRVISDTEWYFVPFRQLLTINSTKAQTPLSHMLDAPLNT